MNDITEEIKNDNNCIIKAFQNNPIAILQIIKKYIGLEHLILVELYNYQIFS